MYSHEFPWQQLSFNVVFQSVNLVMTWQLLNTCSIHYWGAILLTELLLNCLRQSQAYGRLDRLTSKATGFHAYPFWKLTRYHSQFFKLSRKPSNNMDWDMAIINDIGIAAPHNFQLCSCSQSPTTPYALFHFPGNIVLGVSRGSGRRCTSLRVPNTELCLRKSLRKIWRMSSEFCLRFFVLPHQDCQSRT